MYHRNGNWTQLQLCKATAPNYKPPIVKAIIKQQHQDNVALRERKDMEDNDDYLI